ncbi:translocation/assembly module TamB domain-containing protein [Mangrovimonas cancribranchiae]|uniref:Translocation/assembly module TamB domain-containing protein n=1 Tax=Mangrovimonas cancribranchiae TaxID=3080055 RepID=A0AAU6NZM3_9FLAO
MLLFIILVLIFSIPSVQTYLGKYATNYLNEEFNTDFNIGKIGLQFNGDVEIKDILIKDYKDNTLISIIELNTSILNFRNLYNSKLAFGDVDIEGLIFNIKTYKEETETNLDVFVARFDEDNPDNKKSNFLLSSSDVTIENGTFRLIDENNENPTILEFKNINTNTTDLLIKGSDVSTRINALSFTDSRGLKMKKLVSNFIYTPSHIYLEDLEIETKESSLEGEVKFLYKREDLKDFTDKVNVKATFNNTDIALNELNTFYDEFGVNQRAKFSANISGTLNDLFVKNLKLNTSTKSAIYGDIKFKNLFNSAENNFSMEGDFTNLSSNYRDLKALLPNVLGETIPSSFDKLGDFTIVGTSHITPTTILANIEINTDLGFIDSDLKMTDINNIDKASYTGNIIFDEFDIGKFLNDPTLKTTSLNLDVDGSGFTKKNINTEMVGDIFSITYNNYTYQNIEVSGVLKDRIFNGQIISNDKNLKFKFNGLANFSQDINTFDFIANVEHANLRAMNFVTNDELSIFKGKVDMRMSGTTINDAVGDINFTETYYLNEHDKYHFKDFKITSSITDKEHHVTVNSPDIIEGELKGEFLFEDIGKLFLNAVGSIYTNYSPYKVREDQYIDFNFNIYNKIVEVFVPDIKLGSNTYMRGRVESNQGAFKFTFKSPEIRLFDYFAEKIELQLDNKNPLFNTYVEVDSVNTGYYNLSKFKLINKTLNDTLFVRSEFNGGKNNLDVYNLNFYHTINEEEKSVVGIKRSDVTFKGNTWIINSRRNNLHKVEFDKTLQNFDINQIVMSHKQEQIQLSATLRDSTYKNIKLDFKDVHLENVIPDVESLSLQGNVNGELDVFQAEGKYLPNASVTIDSFIVNELNLGDFNADIIGNETLTNYNVDVKIKDDISESFRAIGNINAEGEHAVLDVDLNFDKFNLQPLNPFLDDVLSDIRGLVTGEANVSGRLNQPRIDGMLTMNNSGLRVNELNTDFNFEDNSIVQLENQSFIFNNLSIEDTAHNTKGVLSGSISHDNFATWTLNLEVASDNLLVLNTKEEEESLYYGTAFINGSATIIGPTDQLVIDVIAETNPGTVFVIPLNDTESFGDNSYIHFLTPEEKIAKLKGEDIVIKDVSGLELDFDLEITQDAEIEIVIDKNSGSTIRGRGEGGLLIDINTNGKFNMYGDFVVFEGVYNFLYGGFVQKKFNVLEGNLAWDGDPLKARIDIKAEYKTRANPSPLLDNPINRSIPVNLETTLTGQLEKPEINFDFVFPNVNSTVKSELNYRLDSKEDRDNQALYLLATGAFSNRFNINFTGTITERLNGIVNGLLTSSDNKVNVGLNYEAGENTPEYQTDDRLGVTLQTNISDRIMLNSKVGVPVGGVSETVIAGDVQVDFLLNKEGTLTAKVFNRENSIRNLGEEIGYTQGVGISYSVDFDTFKELLQKIFKGNVNTPKEKPEEDKTKNDDNMLPSYVGFKKSDSD